MQRIARPLALTVFALLGLLVALQFYSLKRIAELTTLGEQREERAKAALAALQAAIEKPRTAPDQLVHPVASPGHASLKPNLLGRESGDRQAASPAHAQPKLNKASKEAQPEHRAAPVSRAGQQVLEEARPATAQQTSSHEVPTSPQDFTATAQTSAANQGTLPADHQAASPPPASQDLSAHQGPDAIQNEQLEGAEASSLKGSQPGAVIARDHNEIEALRKLGKRDYFEFTLVRSGDRTEVAPDIRLQLKKVDLKRSRCSLSIFVENYEYPAELVINEPAVFPIRAMWESVQLVINKAGKDTVAGYLSARKGLLEVGR
jgi:type II secretory pathway component PulJ